jgi:hypothetical protein
VSCTDTVSSAAKSKLDEITGAFYPIFQGSWRKAKYGLLRLVENTSVDSVKFALLFIYGVNNGLQFLCSMVVRGGAVGVLRVTSFLPD